jgi:dipeptidyl aminopeptidase/acylaminoacyl peptidase
MRRFLLVLLLVCIFASVVLGQAAKPKLTLEEFFNSASFPVVKLSPDGNSVAVEVERADWDQQIFRKDLWLYRSSGASSGLVQLTQSGHDGDPQWSPDGQWIAFVSDRKAVAAKAAGGDDDDAKEVGQLYLISPNGGEAFAITSGAEEVHAFAWSPDSKALYFSTREPWTKAQTDEHKKDWKDVVRYRGDERGDVIYRLELADALAHHAALAAREAPNAEKDGNVTPGAKAVSRTALRAGEISVAGDGKRLAFLSSSVSQRQEKIEDVELYVVNLNGAESAPTRLTHNEGIEVHVEWASDHKHVFFEVNLGSAEKKYEDPQPRLYWVDADNGTVERWFGKFEGEIVRYSPLLDGSVLCSCRSGTEIQLYSQANPKASIVKREGWAGTYDATAVSTTSPKLAFVYSATEKPTEVYLAEGADKLGSARAITSFNKLFTERDLPKARPYRWTSDDGTSVEGMLMYPPGKYEAKGLPMFVLIHGGPQDADGNHFEADWYQWDRLAASAGWLVFEPNYRGSTGYGDKFALGIVPEIVSRPGKDILAGVDALVKDGIADANQLAVGGYSYGGYMTNWLITQTTRFKVAVTGAGAVEHVANWGNDDTVEDDAYFLGGLPWEAPDRYRSEAAIFQINKVKTPTHMVAGADDIRVAVSEDYLLDRALHELGIPSNLLIFPGEGHGLGKNPWHGRIKVREELKWLAKYGGVGN